MAFGVDTLPCGMVFFYQWLYSLIPSPSSSVICNDSAWVQITHSIKLYNPSLWVIYKYKYARMLFLVWWVTSRSSLPSICVLAFFLFYLCYLRWPYMYNTFECCHRDPSVSSTATKIRCALVILVWNHRDPLVHSFHFKCNYRKPKASLIVPPHFCFHFQLVLKAVAVSLIRNMVMDW